MLSFNRACNLEDFRTEELQQAMSKVYGASTPIGREDRKWWEVGMAVRGLELLGADAPHAEVLGVGAGHEATLFYLTRVVRRVFATDLYLTPGTWERTATSDMLACPERFWGREWNPRRLVVQHMNALDLRYEDRSFDAVFSSSSIEHFGDDDQVRRSASEMCRVLRPGGICSLSTELRLRGSGHGFPGTRLFAADELHQLVVESGEWEPVDLLEPVISAVTAGVEVDFLEASEDVKAGRPAWSTYPHVVLAFGEYAWTSVHLLLRKR